jgi:hypothetical protein
MFVRACKERRNWVLVVRESIERVKLSNTVDRSAG